MAFYLDFDIVDDICNQEFDQAISYFNLIMLLINQNFLN